MLQRLKNLWGWSSLSPYEEGKRTGQTVAEAIKEAFSYPKSEIVYPNRVKEVLDANPEASLDDLITR